MHNDTNRALDSIMRGKNNSQRRPCYWHSSPSKSICWYHWTHCKRSITPPVHDGHVTACPKPSYAFVSEHSAQVIWETTKLKVTKLNMTTPLLRVICHLFLIRLLYKYPINPIRFSLYVSFHLLLFVHLLSCLYFECFLIVIVCDMSYFLLNIYEWMNDWSTFHLAAL